MSCGATATRLGPAMRHATACLADAHRARVPMLPPAVDPPAERGYGSERNSEPYYDIARVDVAVHRLLTMPIRTSSLRSLGSNLNTFAVESVIDELALAIGRDPLQMRLAHLSDPRAREVLITAAAAADWGAPLPDGHGRGVAFCRYKNRSSYCAVVADVEASRSAARHPADDRSRRRSGRERRRGAQPDRGRRHPGHQLGAVRAGPVRPALDHQHRLGVLPDRTVQPGAPGRGPPVAPPRGAAARRG